MKYTLFISIFVVLCAAQCKKDPIPPVVPTDKPDPIDTLKPPVAWRDSFWAEQNGTQWKADWEAAYYDRLQIPRFRIKATKMLSTNLMQWFSLSDIPMKAGLYNMDSGRTLSTLNNSIPQASVLYVVDQDQGAGNYDVDTTKSNNFVKVIRVDSSLRIVEGTYKVTLKHNKVGPYASGIPDTIVMDKGYFRAKLKQ